MSKPSFRQISPPGCGALSIWRLRGNRAEQEAQLGRLPRLGEMSLRPIGGQPALDQGLVWFQAESPLGVTVEVHLHGGFGVVLGFCQWLEMAGWVHDSQPMPLADQALWEARAPANALWAVMKKEHPKTHWDHWDVLLAKPPALVLAGPTNAGKSTLFNAWLGQEGVTVSPHPGTTRDAVEANLILGEGDQAFEIALVDTAGFWELAPRLDQAALHQTRRQIENSWCVIWVLDATSPPDEETISWIKQIPSHHLRVLNRCDLGETWSPEDRLGGIWIRGSTLEGASQLVTQLELSLLAWTGTPPLPLD